MSGLFNRLKSRKTGPTNTNTNENESTSPPALFDEEGFLCPICHQKFNDHTELAQHYTQTHTQESVVEKENTNGIKNVTKHQEIPEDPNKEIALWKQQFITSEENRIMLSTELIQQKQRADDLEEEIQLIKKHLKNTQNKVAEQSQEIANLKATKDVYNAQLAIFTSELLNTQDELKEKQRQVDTLCEDLIPRSTNDDVDVLKRELISVQHRMNEISLEKEKQIEKLRFILTESYEYILKFDQLENVFNQNLSIQDELISKNTSQIESEINQIKQFVRLTRAQKDKVEISIKYMRNCLTKNQTQIDQLKQTNTQLNNDLERRNESNNKLVNDLQNEQQKTSSYRSQIESLTNEIHELETTLNELKQEKNQFIQTKMNGDQDDERQNLLRQITQEKDQFEQQIKEFRIQNKQITNEKNQLQNEQIRLNKEIDSFKKQLDDNNKDKERQINELKHELSTTREEYTNVEDNLRKANEYNNNQKREADRLKHDLTEQINRLEQTTNQQEQLRNEAKSQLNTIQKEKDHIGQQLQIKQQTIEKLQTTFSELYVKLEQKENHIKRLSSGIRRGVDLARKSQEYLQQNIHTSQANLLATIEQAEEESRLIRSQTLEQIHEEFTKYLSTVHAIILDSKTTLEKQTEIDKLKLIEEQKQLNKIKHDYEKLTKEHHEQKQRFEIQLGDVNHNLLQVSESLSDVTQTAGVQRDKYEKQITSLERELESRTKKHEMQLTALKENLATVRTELRSTNEKLSNVEQIKAEKADIEARLVINQDERHVLLERSLASESKNEKLIFENGQLSKKNTDLEAALQEIAREYQGVQIQKNKLSQRRWLDDDEIRSCMKCAQTFSVTQRKHHCRNCGNVFCDSCSSKTALVAASSKKAQRVCDQCYKDLTS